MDFYKRPFDFKLFRLVRILFNSASTSGFSLPAALVSVLIIGIALSAALSMMSTQNREMTFFKHQLVAMNIKHHILQTMKNLSNCNCHFTQDPTDTDATGANLGPFIIDTTITGDQTSSDINLGSFRSGCDFTTDKNIVVAAGKVVSGGYGLKVSSVKVTNIIATGTPNEYTGKLLIKFEKGSAPRVMQPISIDIIVTAEAGAILPDKTSILHCGPQ